MSEVGAVEQWLWVWIVGFAGFGTWVTVWREAPLRDWPWFCLWPVLLPVMLVCELIMIFQKRRTD